MTLIETSTALACVIVASIFFVMGVWMGRREGRSRTLEAVWNKWNKLSAEEAHQDESGRLYELQISADEMGYITSVKIDGADYVAVNHPILKESCELLHSKSYAVTEIGEACCLECGREWRVEVLCSGFNMVPIDTLLNDPQ